MSKKILIISTSPRQGGNSDILADEFGRGAQEAGHQVEKVSLHDKTIGFCKGCLACQQNQRCVIRDDMDTITQKMHDAEVIVFATPIYYYSVCGQMKTLLDRSNPLFSSQYAFREIYLLASAAENETTAMDGAISDMNGWVVCYENASLKGVVRAIDVTKPGDVRNFPATLQEAFVMGKNA